MMEGLNFLEDKVWDITILNWILSGLFLFIGLLLRKYVSILFTRVLFKLIKNKFGDYSGTQFKDLLTRPISGLIGNIFFFLAVSRLLPKIDTVTIIPSLKRNITQAEEGTRTIAVSLFDLLQHILFIGFIYYGFLLIVRIIEYILNLRYHRAFEEQERGVQQVIPLLKDVTKVVVWILGIIVCMGVVFHINVAALIAGLGVGGIAIAFAAKESLENLIASFMVLVDKPFTIGDWIKVDGVEGVIEKVGFRSSRLRTFDKSVIIIPNRKLIDSNLENYSRRGMRRVSITVGVIYGIGQENIEKAIGKIRGRLKEIPGVNTQQNINMWLDGFGDSQLNVNLVFFVDVSDTVDFFSVKHRANFIIYEAMYQYCRGFAFPTQTQVNGEDINEVFPSAEDRGHSGNIEHNIEPE